MAARWKSHILSLPLALAAACLAAPAAADNPDQFELSPEQLFDATVVSVSKTSEKLMDAPAAIYVLTNEEIMRSGATSVPEALRQVPGVQVAQVNANAWAISARGFNSSLADKLLVLIDGREVYDPLFSGVYWDVQDLVLEDIDRIEVIRGPGASLWGANAVNGVINIITKNSADTQGNMLSVTAGTADHAIVSERYGGALGDLGHYRVYGKYTDRADGETLGDRDAHDGQMAQRSGFRADWKAADTQKDDFTLQGDVYRNTDGDLRPVPRFSAPFSVMRTEDVLATGGNVLGRWNHAFSEDSAFTLQSYVDYTSRNQITLGDQRTSFSVDAQYELPSIGRNKIIIGAGYRYSNDQLTPSPYVSFTGDGESTNLFSSFVQDKITLQPNTWFLTLGSKFEHNDYTGFEVQPNARLEYRPTDTQILWSSVARAVRTPSRLENDLTVIENVLSLGGIPVELRLQPNVDFSSEQLTAYEFGYRNQITSTLTIDATVYYNDYNRLATDSFLGPNIFVVPLLFPFTTTNETSGETHGFELTADWRALDNLDLAGSYTLLDMHLVGPNGDKAINSEIGSDQVPTQQFNARARWNITHDLTFDPSLYYMGALRALQVPEYWRLDARLGWRIMDGLQLSLVGQNLLHGEHREFSASNDAAAPVIGRSFFGNITWRF